MRQLSTGDVKAMENLNRSDATELMFVNHSSVLIRRSDRFLLTDPWHQKPAFGSWLPTMPQYVHPAYLAALGKRLTILISHGHDDHCDDDLLRIFDKDTEIVTANYTAPSVKSRLKKIGFSKITTVDAGGSTIANGFTVRSFINPARSLDDAIYTIDTLTGLVIHCNDNWFEFDPETYDAIGSQISRYSPQNVAFLSQTNSASGYPVTYRNFPETRKKQILTEKVVAMIRQGLLNAHRLGLSTFCSYAGYASVFVKDKPEYLTIGLMPTPRFIAEELLTDEQSRALLAKVRILDFYPGDVLNLDSGAIRKAFIGSANYADQDLREATQRYYDAYGIITNCDSYGIDRSSEFDEGRLDYFLDNLNRFVIRKLSADAGGFDGILGKSFEIEIADRAVSRRIVFGQDGVASSMQGEPPNKRVTTSAGIMARVLSGEILFENLYTGYEAEWQRWPTEVYNRDIILFLVMYSYVYKNRLSGEYGRTARP